MLLRKRGCAVQAMLVGAISVGLLAGCDGGQVTIDTPSVSAPTIPVDFNKPLDQQIAEFNEGFSKVYCPVRELPIADAIADGAKATWNRIIEESKGQNVGIPTFDPKDPALCQ